MINTPEEIVNCIETLGEAQELSRMRSILKHVAHGERTRNMADNMGETQRQYHRAVANARKEAEGRDGSNKCERVVSVKLSGHALPTNKEGFNMSNQVLKAIKWEGD